MDNGEETREMQAKEKVLYSEIYQFNQREEESWRIKSRSLWIKVGDKNNQTKERITRNHIDTIKVDGNAEVKYQEEIKEEAFQHFKRLLSAKEEPNSYERFLRHIPNQ